MLGASVFVRVTTQAKSL